MTITSSFICVTYPQIPEVQLVSEQFYQPKLTSSHVQCLQKVQHEQTRGFPTQLFIQQLKTQL